jgi:cardiolipin synthase
MDHFPILQAIGYSIYLLLIIGTILVVLTRNQHPVKTIAWLTVLIFVPMVGLVCFYLFGQDRRKQRVVAKRYYDKIKDVNFHDLLHDETVEITSDYINLVRLLQTNNHSPVLHGSSVEIITSGRRMFESLIADMENAKNHIHIEFFIFDKDETGRLVKSVLMKKAAQGVEVRFIYDKVANWKVSRKFYYEMQDVGVDVTSLMETRFPLLQSSKINYRNHRKIVVIDGCIGYTGGMNVSNNYSINPHWEDCHLRIVGMGVHGLQANFMLDWHSAGKHWSNTASYFPTVPIYTSNLMQIVTGGPFSEYSNLLQAMISIVLSAKKYIYMQTPYFLPTDTLFEALQIACLSGVDIRLIVSKKSDSSYVDPAAHSYYEDLLRAGMRIYQLQDRFIHAKTLVADDYVSVVGSCNLDYRSFETNFEINCYMYDPDIAGQNKTLFFNNLKYCHEIDYNLWLKRSRWKRLWESVVRLFAPLM